MQEYLKRKCDSKMSKFKIEIPIRAFEQETVYKIENSFSNIEVMWKFFDKESKFTSFFHVDNKNRTYLYTSIQL